MNKNNAVIFNLTNVKPKQLLAHYERKFDLDHDVYSYYYNKGVALRKLMQLEAALESFTLSKRAAKSPENSDYADFSASILWLMWGCYDLGWLLYENRWLTINKSFVRNFNQPLWLGDRDISKQHILLHAEQGLGDTLHFFRYVPLVADLGATITLEVQKPLLNLLSSYFKNNSNKQLNKVTVIAKGTDLPDFDVHCPLMSLPLAFKTKTHTIPVTNPQITADPDKKNYWQEKLVSKFSQNSATLINIKRPKLGFVVSGNPKHMGDAARSISISQLAPCLPSSFDLICLQREFRQIDANYLAIHQNLHYFGKKLIDFTDTAALISLLDIVVTVDTSVAHLAASMGKPTWILLPYSPDFRWLVERTDSPWYPSVKLYRQAALDDWDSVLEKVKTDLAVFKPV